MNVQWFSSKNLNGVLTLDRNYLLLNVSASKNLKEPFRILLGIKDDKNLVIKSVRKDEINRYPKENLLKFTKTKSYLRICSKSVVSKIANMLNLSWKSLPKKFPTTYNAKENYLLIDTQSANK